MKFKVGVFSCAYHNNNIIVSEFILDKVATDAHDLKSSTFH